MMPPFQNAKTTQRRLVVLSEPFTRLVRLLPSCPEIMCGLKGEYDLLVVSPFANEPLFRRQFGGGGVRFHHFEAAGLYRWRPSALAYSLSEYLRTLGFYRRFRHREGMRFYYEGRDVILGRNGQDRRYSLGKRLAIKAMAIAGSPRWAWRLVEWLTGRWIFDTATLAESTAAYDDVVVIQHANWGEQDRMLAYSARKLGWRSILLPYGPDQLTVNGYLIADFDRICVQGPFEEQCAGLLHNIEPDRLVRLGSIWLRNVARIRSALPPRRPETSRTAVILYAGTDTIYFPRKSEFAAVDALVASVRKGDCGDARIIYRPVIQQEEELRAVQEKYGNEGLVTIQLPQNSCIGLAVYSVQSVEQELQEYVSQIDSIDVLVMSLESSLGIDVASCGGAVVSNRADVSDTLARRGMLAGMTTQANICPDHIARTLEDVVAFTRDALRQREKFRAAAQRIAVRWDFAPTDYVSLFLHAVAEIFILHSGDGGASAGPVRKIAAARSIEP